MVPGASVRTMQRMKRLEREALDLHNKVVNGNMKIGVAERELKNRKYREQHERDVAEARKVAAESQGKPPTRTSKPEPAPKGKPVPTPSTATPEEKTERDLRAFNIAFKPALAIFDEATPQARKNIVRQLACALNAEIHFAGEVMKPLPPSLTNGVSEPAAVH